LSFALQPAFPGGHEKGGGVRAAQAPSRGGAPSANLRKSTWGTFGDAATGDGGAADAWASHPRANAQAISNTQRTFHRASFSRERQMAIPSRKGRRRSNARADR